MLFRTQLCRPWLWSAVLLALSAAPAIAQPPSPLELVRGLRDNGHFELALEYLKELEKQPLSPDDKAALAMERAKCLLDASEAEPDEATRLGMVAEAREGLNEFLIKHPKHPRVVEALLTDAKLSSMDAREQLNRARRMDIPPNSDKPDEAGAREAAMQKQKDEAKKARPLFLRAAKQFSEASNLLRARLDDKDLNPLTRRALEREAFEAELAGGINQFNTAETYMPAQLVTGAEKGERNKFLEQAKATFGKLADGPPSNRTVWIARAWKAEVTYEQDDFNAATKEVNDILRAPVLEAEDGKRLANFFQLRRDYVSALSEKSLQKAEAVLKALADWRQAYDNPRKPTPEAYAVRYYQARLLQSLAESELAQQSKGSKAPVAPRDRVLRRLQEAEKLYRTLSQTDNDYTTRATRQRMAVVRRMLGDADQPLAAFDTFEKAQMASLIQLGKLAQAEALPEKTDDEKAKKKAEVEKRQLRTIALLERSRELAKPQDSPADVTDALLRLIYFYQMTNQPYQAAVLGEHVAHAIKSTGGKAALAGLLGVRGYVAAGTRAKGAEDRKADRERAAALARFLDQKYPNDNPTDAARHILATLLVEDKQFLEAFDILLKVRPAYGQITGVRLLEGYLATQLVAPRDSALAPAKKVEIFQRALADLAKTPKPANIATRDDVRGYISTRLRVASLLLAQGRADPAAEKARPGYDQALEVAQEVIAAIPTFECLVKAEGGAKELDLDGQEMMLLARDVQARAAYLRAHALIDAGNFDEAGKTLQPIVDEVNQKGPLFTAEMKKWSEGGDGDRAVEKSKVAQLAATVDKTRVEVILADFRLKVKQGKAAEAENLLNLMVKAGGSVEDSLPLLEPVGRELAARIIVLRKAGKKAEADALGAGLAVLLKKITTVQKLPPKTVLFVGQMLIEVKEFDKALELLKKVAPPAFDGWDRKKSEEIPQELRGQVQAQVRDYAAAQYGIARALREGQKFDEAEKLLKGIIGANDKPGWGSGRLYFRKELALVYEGKGAATADVKAANAEWGKAMKEWVTLFNLQKNRIATAKDATPEQLKEYRNAFADAFLDYNRCLVSANQQLLKDPKYAAKLQKTYEDAGKRLADMERQIPEADWDPAVQHRYVELLADFPKVLDSYKANGGKLFLQKLPVP